jgi:hypothetical protein
MRERCLESLAILLAGLFSAERSRASGISAQLFPPSAGIEPRCNDDAAARARAKANEH